MTYLIALLATALGVAGIVLGEADDSPGLQLIGVAAHRRRGCLGHQDRPARQVARTAAA